MLKGESDKPGRGKRCAGYGGQEQEQGVLTRSSPWEMQLVPGGTQLGLGSGLTVVAEASGT